jgi:hypothetical protein
VANVFWRLAQEGGEAKGNAKRKVVRILGRAKKRTLIRVLHLPFFTMARTKATKQQVGCTVATVLLILLGIVLFAGSWLARYELQQTTENAILDTIIIDSKVPLACPPPRYLPLSLPQRLQESSGYKGWSENFGADRGSSNLHQYFYFCNITNVADVVNKGALPIVQEVGPYYYWYVHLICPPRGHRYK